MMAKPLQLTATMQVVRAHQRRRHVSVTDTRGVVLEAAYSIAKGITGPRLKRLLHS